MEEVALTVAFRLQVTDNKFWWTDGLFDGASCPDFQTRISRIGHSLRKYYIYSVYQGLESHTHRKLLRDPISNRTVLIGEYSYAY